MGLRIIDKKSSVNQANDDYEWRQCLEASTSDWLAKRGDVESLPTASEFVKKFELVKSRVHSMEQVVQIATKMRSTLKSGWCSDMDPHHKVDIATLLVLL